MKAWTVVAYTYQADVHHPECLVADYDPWRGVEHELDLWAEREGIDRIDERSYDSDEFPKVVFASQIDEDETEGPETCGTCGEAILR